MLPPIDSNNIVVAIDWKKAFDSVSHEFILNSLNFFGFPNSFINIIKKWLKNRNSCILVDGKPSRCFQVVRGIPQGDSVSGYIFIICMEILMLILKNLNQTKPNILLPGGTPPLGADCFADDVLTILRGDGQSILCFKNAISLFSRCSGLEINRDKTEVMVFGPNERQLSEILAREGYKIVDQITHLGFKIDKNLSNLSDNWTLKIQKLANLKNLLLSFSIPLASKINITKCFLYSQLCYIGSLKSPSEQQLKTIEKIILSFLYPRNATFSAARTFADQTLGGLGLPEIKTFLLALRTKFSLRAQLSNQPWAKEIKLHFPDNNICLNTSLTDNFSSSPYTAEHIKNIINFQTAYYKHKDNRLSSPIFRSIFSTSTNQPFNSFNPPIDIAESAILSADFCDIINFQRGTIYSYGEFLTRFRVNFNIYFHARNIVIPAIRNFLLPNKPPRKKKLDVLVKKNPQARIIRKFIANNQSTFHFKNAPSTKTLLRQATLNINNDEDLCRYLTFANTWNTSFLPTDLKTFCLFFCSNKLNYNYNRSRWANVNPNCSLCRLNQVAHPPPETITHIFLECPFTSNITHELLLSLSENQDSINSLIFSGSVKCNLQKFINIEILTVLFFLHKSKTAVITPSNAGLKQHLALYRNDMAGKSKVYRELLACAKSKLGPTYCNSFL